MDFWTAIVAIASIAIPFEFVKFVIKQKYKQKEANIETTSVSKIESLERRIESLETIVIDFEKEKRFRDLR